MSAVRRLDVGPEREMSHPLTFGNLSIDVLVRFVVSYPSRWHRGHGVDPDITIVSVTYDAGLERMPLNLLPGMHDEICALIEADELED